MNATRPPGLAGPFDTLDCGHGLWRVSQRTPRAAVVYLQGFRPPEGLEQCSLLSIDWQDAPGGAGARLTLPSGEVAVPVASAFVLEPLQHLYDALPLARPDPAALRFRRRVFRLVSVPGGSALIGWLAARVRRRAGTLGG